MSDLNGKGCFNRERNCQEEKNGPGSKEHQGSRDKREHSTISQKSVKEESTRTEHHHSSFQSARSVFESTPGIRFSQKETTTSSRTNSQSTVLQSFHTVNKRKQHPNFVTFYSPEKDKISDNHSPNKKPPDKPDRKSKAMPAKNESSSPNLNDTAVGEVEEKSCNNSIPVTTRMFDDIHNLQQQDSTLVLTSIKQN